MKILRKKNNHFSLKLYKLLEKESQLQGDSWTDIFYAPITQYP